MTKTFRCHDAEACALGQKQCPMPTACGLHQIQEPTQAEQEAWHAGLDEGRAQAAPAAVAATAKAWELSAADVEHQSTGAGLHFNQGVAEGMRTCAKDLRAALAATPAAAPTAKGYDSGIQTANRVTLIFETQDAATAWFESFSDAYDAENGTRSIALPIPIPTTQAAAPVDKSPELQGSMVDKTVNLQGAAAAQVVLPEPDAAVTEVMGLVQDYFVVGTDEARGAIETKLRALLAGVSAPAAQAVSWPVARDTLQRLSGIAATAMHQSAKDQNDSSANPDLPFLGRDAVAHI